MELSEKGRLGSKPCSSHAWEIRSTDSRSGNLHLPSTPNTRSFSPHPNELHHRAADTHIARPLNPCQNMPQHATCDLEDWHPSIHSGEHSYAHRSNRQTPDPARIMERRGVHCPWRHSLHAIPCMSCTSFVRCEVRGNGHASACVQHWQDSVCWNTHDIPIGRTCCVPAVASRCSTKLTQSHPCWQRSSMSLRARPHDQAFRDMAIHLH